MSMTTLRAFLSGRLQGRNRWLLRVEKLIFRLLVSSLLRGRLFPWARTNWHVYLPGSIRRLRLLDKKLGSGRDHRFARHVGTNLIKVE